MFRFWNTCIVWLILIIWGFLCHGDVPITDYLTYTWNLFIKHQGLLNVPQLVWHDQINFYRHLIRQHLPPVSCCQVFGSGAVATILLTLVCWWLDLNTQLSACEANTLTDHPHNLKYDLFKFACKPMGEMYFCWWNLKGWF